MRGNVNIKVTSNALGWELIERTLIRSFFGQAQVAKTCFSTKDKPKVHQSQRYPSVSLS